MISAAGRSLLLAALTAGTGVLCRISPDPRESAASGVIMKLPAVLPGLVSDPREPDPVEKAMLPSDTQFARAVYYTPGAAPERRDLIQCEIVLSGAERRSIHRPEVCLQGQGWTITDSRIRTVAPAEGRNLEVRDLSIRKETGPAGGPRRIIRAHYFYWFIGEDVSTASHVGRLWLTLRDNLTRGINHRWAYATALAFVTQDQAPGPAERPRDNEATVALLQRFVRDLAPRFQKSFMDNPPVAAAH